MSIASRIEALERVNGDTCEQCRAMPRVAIVDRTPDAEPRYACDPEPCPKCGRWPEVFVIVEDDGRDAEDE